MRHFLMVSTALAGIALAALPAAAQTAGEASWSAEGRLEDGDSQDEDQRPYDEHRLQLEAGRRYNLTASSDDFDTVLSLYRPGSDEPVATNDDYGGTFNSRIAYTAETGGEYVLRVRGYAAESRGGYRLAAETLPPLPPATPVPAGRPWSATGQLEAMPPEAMEGPYSEHRLQLDAGQRYRFSVEGAEAVLRLVRESDEAPVAESYGGTPLTHAPTESGTYSLRIQSGTGEAGTYTARAERLPPLPAPISAAPSAQAQLTWSLWQGELAEGDPDNNGQYFDDYLVPMRSGETRLLMVDAEGTDTMVSVLTMDGRNGDPIAIDDDSGPGVNPLLVFQASEDGNYVVRVSSFSSGATGAYRLRISDAVTPPLPPEDPMAYPEGD